MAIMPILEFPDARLRTKAVPVTVFDAGLATLVSDMVQTMYDAKGIGLAATQVDRHIQLIVVDISEDRSDLRVLINPLLTNPVGSQVYKEGCLSVPTVYADVKRADQITVSALDQFGKAQQFTADGLLAVCVQHEMDHLLGKVFVDYLSPLKRMMAMAKLDKIRRDRIADAISDAKKAVV